MKKNINKKEKKIIRKIFLFIIFLSFLINVLSFSKFPTKINYGVSFNTLYAKELNLSWREVYDMIIEELRPQKIRLAAHWNLIEPENNSFNFSEIDYQIEKAASINSEIILAVGKRLPRWPECHIPNWAQNLSQSDQEEEILDYIEEVVERYKNNENIKIWQVENEPFLTFYAKDHCNHFSSDFLDKEIDFVKKLDPTRDVLITDSGELSTWRKTYNRGDIFGTTLYIYAWNKYVGDFKNFVWPGLYSLRRNFWNLVYGKKDSIIAELSLEPWLDKPISQESLEVQIDRMSKNNFENILSFAKKTGFETQYLWGAEWWYYMKLNGDSWYWERGKEIFR